MTREEDVLSIIDECLTNGGITHEAENYSFWVDIRYYVQKQIPMKPKMEKHTNVCPVCGEEVILNLTDGGGFDYKVNYCPKCGQKILWENKDGV